MSPQHLDALQLANQRRFARAAIRRRITDAGGTGYARRTPAARTNGMQQAATELEPRPDELHTMTAWDFLRWSCPARDCRRILSTAEVHNAYRRLGELSPRQVQVVCDELRRGPVVGFTSEAA